jgi:hypothetical protein
MEWPTLDLVVVRRPPSSLSFNAVLLNVGRRGKNAIMVITTNNNNKMNPHTPYLNVARRLPSSPLFNIRIVE